MHSLLIHFSNEPDFWEHLIVQEDEIDLVELLFYTKRYTHKILHNPMPNHDLKKIQVISSVGMLDSLLDFSYERTVTSDHTTCRKYYAGLVVCLLFVS